MCRGCVFNYWLVSASLVLDKRAGIKITFPLFTIGTIFMTVVTTLALDVSVTRDVSM